MKPFKDLDKAQKDTRRTGSTRLQKGAYVCKLLGAKLEPGKDGNSDMLRVQFDIAEGENAEFFKKQYEANKDDNKKYKGQTTIYLPKDDGSEKDGWTKNTFAKWINALEDSNEGYRWDWDEKKWKNKLIGLVFGETGTVIDGKEIVYTECRFPIDVKTVRDGKAPEAKFKAKNGYGETGATTTNNGEATDFMNIPDGIEDELPF